MARYRQDLYDSNMGRATDIRSYGLFGEAGDLPDVLHCETIAARSALHDWELAPHRHARLHQLLLVTRGGGTARLEGGAQPLRPRSLVNVPAGDVHAFVFVPGTDGWVVTLPDTLFADPLARGDAAVLGRAGVAVADAGPGRTMARLAAEFSAAAPGRALVLRGLALVLLGQASRVFAREPAGARDSPSSNLLRRFDALLDAHAHEHWSVARYARALAVTPTHLSRVARAETGRSASRLAEERLLREARRNLAFTSLPIKSIAYALGFADPAHFSRAFARAAGCSPRAFRQRLG